MQNGLYRKIDSNITMLKIVAFDINNVPKIERILEFDIAKGIPPPNIPCGQTYLQKYGLPIPAAFVKITGKTQIVTTNMTYFIYVKNLSFFVENFFNEILCNKSWNQPNGHKKPQINLPNITPNKINIPVI